MQVRVYEREPGSILQREVRTADGKDRKSLGHRDRALAENQARQLAQHLARLQLNGFPAGPVTFGVLFGTYLANRGPQLAPNRLRFMETTAELLLRQFGAAFPVDDFGQHHSEVYLQERRAGRLVPAGRRAAERPKDGTLRNELQALSCICNWGIRYRRNGQRLLAHNPVRDVRQPQEQNPARPRAGRDRFAALLAVADQADPSGQFRLMLALAWHTGRRINAICHLRRSDVLLGTADVRRALASAGEDESHAEDWSEALRWAAAWDKCGYLTFSPMPMAIREEVARYLRRHPCVGDAWLFPSSRNPAEPTSKLMASHYLRKAERLADLPHQLRGGWHSFRRGWATARKSLPVQDVMRAGGWRDVKALQTAYQGADASTMRRVVDYCG